MDSFDFLGNHIDHRLRFGAQSLACNVSITWDRSPGLDVAGYAIDYGMQSGNYEHGVDVDNVMEFTLTSLSVHINR